MHALRAMHVGVHLAARCKNRDAEKAFCATNSRSALSITCSENFCSVRFSRLWQNDLLGAVRSTRRIACMSWKNVRDGRRVVKSETVEPGLPPDAFRCPRTVDPRAASNDPNPPNAPRRSFRLVHVHHPRDHLERVPDARVHRRTRCPRRPPRARPSHRSWATRRPTPRSTPPTLRFRELCRCSPRSTSAPSRSRRASPTGTP